MYHFRYRCPFSDIYLISDGAVLTGLYFAAAPALAGILHNSTASELPVFSATRRWLDAYFSGRQPDFMPAYRLDGLTPFRKLVVAELRKIPFGQTTTYGAIAQRIAHRTGQRQISAQAVGGAVGWNPVCLLVPCHRVLGATGQLGGYSGGLQNKIQLLRLEGHDID